MDLSVNLNSVYGAEDDWADRVERAAAAGVDAVGVYGLEDPTPVAEAAGVDLLLEPLNTPVDHPDHWLNTVGEGVMLTVAADSPAVGVLFDIYHEQVETGNVTDTLRDYITHVGHVHVADSPGRAEPGTGEIDYEFVLNALADTGYDGYVECEFWPNGDPDQAVQRVRELLG